MRAERFKQIDQLFEDAIARHPDQRQAYLDEACAGDTELRKEVESLLKAYDLAGNFIEEPAVKFAAQSMGDESAYSSIGREVGPYRILSLLGAGGMGEVYLAEDARLGRKVALKLLPAEFTKDAERVSRFEREARAASALNHPNIITIYEIGKLGDTHFIATEYIDGQTLKQRFRSGMMEVEEALDTAIQIASALAEAHGAGIVHRDIKPENIMLRRDGYVKVLDFGLAKLMEDESSAEARGTSSTARTDTGRVMGTVNYMSPEQALGQVLDHRTDVFSLGVVLYEMLTGTHPFKGDSVAATFNAILNRTPAPVTNSNPALPTGLCGIISRSLEKDRELRYQTASDLRAELKRLARDINSSPAVAADHQPSSSPLLSSAWSSPSKPVLIAVITLAVVLLVWLLVLRPGKSPEKKLDTPVIPSALAITDAAGEEFFPSLSPDGKSLVYVTGAAGNLDIYEQKVGGKNFNNLTSDSPDDDSQPAYSPNGERIVFRSEREGGGIFLMGASGESVRRLTDFGYNPSWSPDGKEIVFAVESVTGPGGRLDPKSQLWAVNIATREKRLITAGDGVQPAWSPAGHRIAYWSKQHGGQRDIWTVSATSDEPIQVTDDLYEDWNPVWAPDGRHLFFISTRGGNENVWRVEIDERSGKVLSEPEPITLPSSSTQHICLSRDGRKMAYVQMPVKTNAQKLEFSSQGEKVLLPPIWVTQGTKYIRNLDLSPDGEWYAYDTRVDQQFDIFVMKKDGTGQRNLTEDAFRNVNPRWSPDGKRIAFYSDRSGTYQIWMINPDGSGLRQITFAPDPGVVYPVWSPDLTRLAYSVYSGHSYILDLTKPWQEQTPQPVTMLNDRDNIFVAFGWSPDGKKLAGIRTNPHTKKVNGIYVYHLNTEAFVKVTDFGNVPQWMSDSRRLIFCDKNKLYLVDSLLKKPRELFSAAPHEVNRFKISKDDRTIYYSISTREGDIWLATLE
jgi:eukaryotic-like serine/threonine-protein kinase